MHPRNAYFATLLVFWFIFNHGTCLLHYQLLNDVTYGGFGYWVNYLHRNVHNFIGYDTATHFNVLGCPAADPLFVLFHTFLDYVRVMRADCADYDKIPNDKLEECEPDCFEVFNTTLDYEMVFTLLCDDESLVEPYCAYTEGNTIPVRQLYDTSTNSHWNVLYELGDFWSQNDELMGACSDNINDTWFSAEIFEIEDAKLMMNGVAVDHEEVLMNDNMKRLRMIKNALQSPAVGVLAVAVVVLTFLALYARFVCKENRKLAINDKRYGSVTVLSGVSA